MSWRTVVITKTSKLDYSMGHLVVRDVESTVKVHISEISVLVIESTAVSVTAALLCELIKKKVKVIFCDEKHNPLSELTPYYGQRRAVSMVQSFIMPPISLSLINSRAPNKSFGFTKPVSIFAVVNVRIVCIVIQIG